MYQMLFKNRKFAIGFVALTLFSVAVLFSGNDSAVMQLKNAFGGQEAKVEESAGHEAEAPAAEPNSSPEEPLQFDEDEEELSFVDDEELVDSAEGQNPNPEADSEGTSEGSSEETSEDAE